MATLDLPSCDGFQNNEKLDHNMRCGEEETEVDVKPAKEELSSVTSIFCLKDEMQISEVEKLEDCFLLEFDPYKPDNTFPLLSKLLYGDGGDDDDDDDAAIVAEHGENACRDYPHSRHLCVTYPFDSTPHHTHCKMCYCYVCDAPAPCDQWTRQSSYFKHCEATHEAQIWRDLRNAKKRNIGAYFDEIYSQSESCYEDNHIETIQLNT